MVSWRIEGGAPRALERGDAKGAQLSSSGSGEPRRGEMAGSGGGLRLDAKLARLASRGDASGLEDAEAEAAGEIADGFLEQALGGGAGGGCGFPSPAHGAAVNGVYQRTVAALHSDLFVTELGEPAGHLAQTALEAIREGKGDQPRVFRGGQSRRRADGAIKRQPGGAAGKASPGARPIHFLQRPADGREIREVDSALQAVVRVVLDPLREPGEVEDGADTVASHHILERQQERACEAVGVGETALRDRHRRPSA